MKTRKFVSAALAASFLSVSAVAPALAQDAAADAEAGAAAEYQFELTDQHVDAFVDAALEIDALISELQPRLQAAESQEAQAAIQQEAQTEMETIVADSGLTVDEYNAIATAARSDQSVAARIRAEAESRSAG